MVIEYLLQGGNKIFKEISKKHFLSYLSSQRTQIIMTYNFFVFNSISGREIFIFNFNCKQSSLKQLNVIDEF